MRKIAHLGRALFGLGQLGRAAALHRQLLRAASDGRDGLLFLTFLAAGTLAGPVFGTVQDLVAPHARATAVAIIGVVGVIIGQGMGPLLVGALSDLLNTSGNVGGLRNVDDRRRLDQRAHRPVLLGAGAPHRACLSGAARTGRTACLTAFAIKARLHR
jgi:MFS family permease